MTRVFLFFLPSFRCYVCVLGGGGVAGTGEVRADACGAGSFRREIGGRRRQPFGEITDSCCVVPIALCCTDYSVVPIAVLSRFLCCTDYCCVVAIAVLYRLLCVYRFLCCTDYYVIPVPTTVLYRLLLNCTDCRLDVPIPDYCTDFSDYCCTGHWLSVSVH